QNLPVNVESKIFSNWRRKLAHQIIDAGASIYVSHGTPRLEGIEIYKNCPIFYGLGNFIFQTKTDVAFYTKEVWSSVLVHIHSHSEKDAAANNNNANNSSGIQYSFSVSPASNNNGTNLLSFDPAVL